MENEYRYIALTKYSTTLPDLLRERTGEIMQQYNVKTDTWERASTEMYGIYTGEIESKAISEQEAFEIIHRWRRIYKKTEISFIYNKNGEIESYSNGKKIGEIGTMGNLMNEVERAKDKENDRRNHEIR